MGIFPQHITDEQLVQLYSQQADDAALGELFTRYQHLVVSVCYKYLQDIELAKDALQQIFEKLTTILPQQQNIVLFKAWLHTVAKNHCLMQLRKTTLPIKQVENIENYDVENDQSMHLVLEKEEQLNNMHKAMQLLEDKQQRCLDLFYLQKMSYAAIQSQTGFTFMEVKSCIQNGKRNLKKIMLENN